MPSYCLGENHGPISSSLFEPGFFLVFSHLVYSFWEYAIGYFNSPYGLAAAPFVGGEYFPNFPFRQLLISTTQASNQFTLPVAAFFEIIPDI